VVFVEQAAQVLLYSREIQNIDSVQFWPAHLAKMVFLAIA
jgi:hypothetical protein